jgi:dTDP-4-dehydrorhamnose reductase
VAKKSFLDLMLELAEKRDVLSVVDDEINSVTYAADLAAATRALVDGRAPAGLYHVTNAGQASWYELALELFRLSGHKVRVEPVPASRFPRKARRPAKAVLRNTKLEPLRPWQQAVEAYLASRGSSQIW